MGRQIGFYFDKKDEKEFLELPQFKEIAFLKFREMKSPQYDEIRLEKFSIISDAQSQTIMCSKSDLNNLAYREIGGGLYYIDAHDSPVIEFSRSGYKAELNRLISGRLWYQHKYWSKDKHGNDVILEKSKELEKLYNSLARWIRKHCTRLPNGNYIAPHAMELYKSGVELSP